MPPDTENGCIHPERCTGSIHPARQRHRQTVLRNIFDVDLDPLARITHLLIGFWNIFWIWQFHRHLTALSQKMIQSGDGTCIVPLPQLHPEDHQAGVRIPAAHVLDGLDLFGTVLVWMAVRVMRAVFQ